MIIHSSIAMVALAAILIPSLPGLCRGRDLADRRHGPARRGRPQGAEGLQSGSRWLGRRRFSPSLRPPVGSHTTQGKCDDEIRARLLMLAATLLLELPNILQSCGQNRTDFEPMPLAGRGFLFQERNLNLVTSGRQVMPNGSKGGIAAP